MRRFCSKAVASDDYESNDTQETATLLIVGGEDLQTHTLNPEGDVDWFRFYAREDEIYDIFTTAIGDNIDLVIEIYDEDGNLVGDPLDNFFQGEPERSSFKAPSAGQFFLKVFDYCDTADPPCNIGSSDAYSIYVFVPVGAAGGTDLAVTNSFSGTPKWAPPFLSPSRRPITVVNRKTIPARTC